MISADLWQSPGVPPPLAPLVRRAGTQEACGWGRFASWSAPLRYRNRGQRRRRQLLARFDDRVTLRTARLATWTTDWGWVRLVEPRYRPRRAPIRIYGGIHFHTGLRSARERADRTPGTDEPRRCLSAHDRTGAQSGSRRCGSARVSGNVRIPDRRAPFRKPIPALQGACFAARRDKGNATQPSAVPEFRSK